MARTPLQAMLLPPVDGKLALWINQPANFAVLGVGPERGTEVLYQQTALEAVPESGYVYVPMRADPDVDYEQVYLVASPAPIDLSAFPTAARDIDPAARVNFNAESMRYVLTSSEVVDGYQMADTVDRTVCTNRAILPKRRVPERPVRPVARVSRTSGSVRAVPAVSALYRASPHVFHASTEAPSAGQRRAARQRGAAQATACRG